MTFLKSAAAALCMSIFVAGGSFVGTDAYAQAKKPMTAAEKRAKSAECSAAADKQGLKGKARKAFRSKCKRGQS